MGKSRVHRVGSGIVGIILAGGQATRLRARNGSTLVPEGGKAFLALDGVSLIERTIGLFDQVFDRILSATAQIRAESDGLVRWDGELTEWSLINSARKLDHGVLALLPVAWSVAFLRTERWPDPPRNPGLA